MQNSSLKRIEVKLLSILIFTFILIYWMVFDFKLDIGGDNYDYLNYAKSIATGHGYSSPYSLEYLPVNWFPPGYSTMLAGLMIVFGNNIVLFKLINGLLLLGSLILFYFIIRKLTNNEWLAFAVNFYLVFNIGLLKFGYTIMSEIPYLFLTMLALFFIVINDTLIKSKFWKSPILFVIISVALAYYFRGIGLSIIAAVAIHFSLKKEWKTLAIFLGGVSLLHLPYIIRNKYYGLNGRYMDALLSVNPWRPELDQADTINGFLGKVWSNFIVEILNVYPKLTFPTQHIRLIPSDMVPYFGFILLSITILGLLVLKSRYKYLIFSFYVFNLLIVILYHSGNDFRYLITLIPIMVFGFVNGLGFFLEKITENKRVIVHVLILGGIFLFPRMFDFNYLSKQEYHKKFSSFIEMSEFIKSMGYSNITIATRKPSILHYYSGAYVHRYKFSDNADELMLDLVQNNVDFIYFDALGYGSNYHYLLPALNQYRPFIKSVRMVKDPNSILLQFNRIEVQKILKRKGLLQR